MVCHVYRHSPGGGKKKIFSQKVDVSSVKSKIIIKRTSLPGKQVLLRIMLYQPFSKK